jgi:AraC family transcriptional regulator
MRPPRSTRPAMSPAKPGEAVMGGQRPVQRIISGQHFSARHAVFACCQFEPHSHSAFTVTSVIEGKMAAVIGTGSFELSAGDVAFTNPREIHSAVAIEAEFISLELGTTLINELVTEMGLTRITAEVLFNKRVARDESVSLLLRAISKEMAGAQPGSRPMLDAMARQLLIHLLRSHLTVRKSASVELSRAGPVDRRLRRAIEFIHDNFGRDLSLEEIASAAYLSEYHFARLFKQITGATPHLYLANLRLERARTLLAETPFPIIQVAAMVGYQSPSHFTKMFKSVTGLTPRAYRESASVQAGDSDRVDDQRGVETPKGERS